MKKNGKFWFEQVFKSHQPHQVGISLAIKEKNEFEYDSLNQLTAEDVYLSAGGSFSKVYAYDSRGNRTGSDKYAYEYRPSKNSLSTSYVNNYGMFDAIPYYDTTTLFSTIKAISFNGTVPTLTFRYRDSQILNRYYTCTTTLLSINVDTLHKGYYVATYYATDDINVELYFNVRFKVGNLATTAGSPTEEINYLYSTTWLDQLASYDIIVNGNTTSHAIAYDAQGNPTQITNVKYNGMNYAYAYLYWDGRQLNNIYFATVNGPTFMLAYTYNDQGYRTAKSILHFSWGTPSWILDKTINYQLNGDKVIYETDGDYGILFTYDYNGTLISFNYDDDLTDNNVGIEYFYLRNQQGDITLITNSAGDVVIRYRYDAYGNMTATPTLGYDDLTPINPYTYKGYRYDIEIGLYYLNSRYYNPQIGRFVNGDGLLGEMGDILSTNMYAYNVNSFLFIGEVNQDFGTAFYIGVNQVENQPTKKADVETTIVVDQLSNDESYESCIEACYLKYPQTTEENVLAIASSAALVVAFETLNIGKGLVSGGIKGVLILAGGTLLASGATFGGVYLFSELTKVINDSLREHEISECKKKYNT